MFTMKFYREKKTDDNGIQMEAFSCARYNIAEGERTMIYMYPTLEAKNPTVMHLHGYEDENTYYELFVENQAGKTIDRHKAFTVEVKNMTETVGCANEDCENVAKGMRVKLGLCDDCFSYHQAASTLASA